MADAIFHWCAAKVFLEVLAEEGGVLKAQPQGHLLDTKVGGEQQVTDVLVHHISNPLVGRLLAATFADGGKILGRDAELPGVVFYRLLLDGGIR